MDYPKYEVESSTQSDYYEFTSNGTNGQIHKLIQYSQISNGVLYNLAFGDKVEEQDEQGNLIYTLNDSVISDNGDRDIILATVAATVYEYTTIYPNRKVYFTGSTSVKTRLYRMAISNNFEKLSEDFHIFGLIENKETQEQEPEPFNKGGNYVGFIVYKKTNTPQDENYE